MTAEIVIIDPATLAEEIKATEAKINAYKTKGATGIDGLYNLLGNLERKHKALTLEDPLAALYSEDSKQAALAEEAFTLRYAHEKGITSYEAMGKLKAEYSMTAEGYEGREDYSYAVTQYARAITPAPSDWAEYEKDAIAQALELVEAGQEGRVSGKQTVILVDRTEDGAGWEIVAETKTPEDFRFELRWEEAVFSSAAEIKEALPQMIQKLMSH